MDPPGRAILGALAEWPASNSQAGGRSTGCCDVHDLRTLRGRRGRWWPVAIAAVFIASAGFVAPTAYAAPHHSPRKPTVGRGKVLVRHGKVVKVLRVPHDHGHHGHHGHGGGCHYPPSGTASVS